MHNHIDKSQRTTDVATSYFVSQFSDFTATEHANLHCLRFSPECSLYGTKSTALFSLEHGKNWPFVFEEYKNVKVFTQRAFNKKITNANEIICRFGHRLQIC